jgi:hypothetical protein
MDDPLDDRFAGDAGVDKEIGDTDAQGGGQQRGCARNLEGEKDRIKI